MGKGMVYNLSGRSILRCLDTFVTSVVYPVTGAWIGLCRGAGHEVKGSRAVL